MFKTVLNFSANFCGKWANSTKMLLPVKKSGESEAPFWLNIHFLCTKMSKPPYVTVPSTPLIPYMPGSRRRNNTHFKQAINSR